MSLTVTTFNANGLRSAARKGFFRWFQQRSPEILCIQETKAQRHQLAPEITDVPGYLSYFNDAQKKGYSGVAIYTKREPDRLETTLGWPDFDAEGRYLRADYGRLSVISLYLPSGTSGDHRQEVKYDVMDRLLELFKRFRRQRRDFIICGDLNIAHKPIDLKNWRSNQKHSGFLPEERAWLDRLFGEVGFVDAFRVVNPLPDQYTWWSQRGQARARNVGWRIDYHVVSPALKDKIKRAEIYTEENFSDHAPLTIDYGLDW